MKSGHASSTSAASRNLPAAGTRHGDDPLGARAPQVGFVTVVSGLPRSGTSMMMRALEAGGLEVITDGARAADADNPGGYYELEAVKQLARGADAGTGWLRDADGKAVKVIYRLLYHLPDDYEYKVIYLKRRLEEVVASQQVMIARRGSEGSTLGATTLTEVFAAETRKAEAWLREQENFQTLWLDYHEVVADPAAASARVARFLGLALDVDAMAQIVDPGLYRQRA